ncbi:conserved hypothetical protein [Ricinus communis]|uniref:CLAVATA3/ESR (CLE)-related protein 45 n=1 Tax=Ricinus communis TaxID=3988 RepID=B9S8W5_RICCO|nr:conserved hypothetical protein [Ricinus communis]
MVVSAHRVLIVFICIGFLAAQSNQAYGLTSIELATRDRKTDPGRTVSSSQRILEDVSMQSMNTEMQKKSAYLNKANDPNQSSKRRVRRGSDPIHNRS